MKKYRITAVALILLAAPAARGEGLWVINLPEYVRFTNASGDNSWQTEGNWQWEEGLPYNGPPFGLTEAERPDLYIESGLANYARTDDDVGRYHGIRYIGTEDGEGRLEVYHKMLSSNVNTYVGVGNTGELVIDSGEQFEIGRTLVIGKQGTVEVKSGMLDPRRGPPTLIEGRLRISGTGQLQQDEGVDIQSTGTFSAAGSGIAVWGRGAGGINWNQEAGGIFEALIDEDGFGDIHISGVFDDDTYVEGGNVSFADGALLDVGWVEEPVYGTWKVMRWDGDLTDDGLAFAPGVNTDLWSFEIHEDGIGGSLTVTAVPQP